MSRNGEQLDIERCHAGPGCRRGVPVQMTTRQDRIQCIPGEELEPALGVVDTRQEQRLDQEIEGPAHDVPVRRLTDAICLCALT